MKRILLITALLTLAAPAAHAQTQGYVCLFIDDARTSQCATSATFPMITNMHIWCLPRFDGSYCAEFMIDYPADPTVIAATVTWNPALTVVLGSLNTGASACFFDCQTTWFKPVSQMIICQNGNQNMLSVVPHPLSRGIYFASCIEPRDQYPAVPWNNLYLNYVDGVDPECTYTAVAESTWGAIKQMFRE